MLSVFGLLRLFQGIVPVAATAQVKELFVGDARIAAAQSEAATLPAYNISKVSQVT